MYFIKKYFKTRIHSKARRYIQYKYLQVLIKTLNSIVKATFNWDD